MKKYIKIIKIIKNQIRIRAQMSKIIFRETISYSWSISEIINEITNQGFLKCQLIQLTNLL